MNMELDLGKSIEENASDYFERAKLAKKKREGIIRGIREREEQKKKKEERKKEERKAEDKEGKGFEKKRNKKWFEKYRWFFSSEGFLVIGGRDAQSNEEVVKKRMSEGDIYFHAEVFGAPHCIIITGGKRPSEKTFFEAAQFAVTFSKAWEEGRASADAYSAKPEQVSKKAPSGESLGSGAFMIYGEREWHRNTPLACAVGYNEKEGIVMAGPTSAVKKSCPFSLEIKQGKKKKSDTAKEIRRRLEKKAYYTKLDDIIKVLPNGPSEIKG